MLLRYNREQHAIQHDHKMILLENSMMSSRSVMKHRGSMGTIYENRAETREFDSAFVRVLRVVSPISRARDACSKC